MEARSDWSTHLSLAPRAGVLPDAVQQRQPEQAPQPGLQCQCGRLQQPRLRGGAPSRCTAMVPLSAFCHLLHYVVYHVFSASLETAHAAAVSLQTLSCAELTWAAEGLCGK